MLGELSHGLASLATRGRHIISLATGEPMLLRGVNRSGLEYAGPDGGGFLANTRITEAEMDVIARDWGANLIRLPFTQSRALDAPGDTAYLAALDQCIAWAAARGAYTLLDLQWLDPETPHGQHGDGSVNRVPALPDRRTPELWSRLASRYRDEPAVLFDLFNEPHTPMEDDPDADRLESLTDDERFFPLPSRHVGMDEWQPWARLLVRTIRAAHPESLVFVSGVNWAYEVWGHPLTVFADSREVIPNLVYSTHVYRGKGPAWDDGDQPEAFPLSPDTPSQPNWHAAFGALAGAVPVFAGEWGGTDDDLAWGAALADYFDRLGIGWAAWSWADWPHLIDRATGRPTRFGELVRTRLGSGSANAGRGIS